jgi:beta-galactosidase
MVSNPRLWSAWSVGTPNLYVVKTQVYADGSVTDTYQSTFGIRTFTFDANNGFSINGTGMKLNGVCMHHDLGSLGAAVNYRAIERQMEIMKRMGCNSVRASHNPPDPALPDVCDRLGIVVMDGAFDCWESGKTTNDYHLSFSSWAHTDINAFVARDRNHPSVIMWSIGNEIGGATAATAQNLRNWVREMDTTRPVTWASNSMGDSNYQTIANGLDLVGYNYGAGNYDSHHSSHTSWKMFGSETSSAVRSRGIYKTPTNQNILSGSDNQCSSYDNSVVSWGTSAEQSYKDTNSRSFIAGEFIWTGFDYIGEPTPYSYPAKSSYFGIVDTCGFPKDIFYFYQARWTTTAMVHILPHWNWSSGQTVEVWAYSNCDSVELFLNGSSLGSKTFASGTYHLVWSVPFASGTLRAQGAKNGSVAATHEIATSGSASKIQLVPDRTTITGDGKDLAFVETNVLDANNVFGHGARENRRRGQRKRDIARIVQGNLALRVEREVPRHSPVYGRERPDHRIRELEQSLVCERDCAGKRIIRDAGTANCIYTCSDAVIGQRRCERKRNERYRGCTLDRTVLRRPQSFRIRERERGRELLGRDRYTGRAPRRAILCRPHNLVPMLIKT